MVLTSHPFCLPASPSNFFAACGTFMIWKCAALSKSHFFGGTFHSCLHFYGRSFGVWLHFYGRTFLIPKIQNTKFTRKIDEENTKDTRNFAYFSSKQRTESSGKNSPLIYEKSVGWIGPLKSKGSKGPDEIKGSKWAFGLWIGQKSVG